MTIAALRQADPFAALPDDQFDLLMSLSQEVSFARDEAIVQEGAESFVFEEIDGRFVRREVEVEYRDQRSAVLANDGDLTPGKVVVAKGAYQIQLAMKQKAGDGAHADHHHH